MDEMPASTLVLKACHSSPWWSRHRSHWNLDWCPFAPHATAERQLGDKLSVAATKRFISCMSAFRGSCRYVRAALLQGAVSLTDCPANAGLLLAALLSNLCGRPLTALTSAPPLCALDLHQDLQESMTKACWALRTFRPWFHQAAHLHLNMIYDLMKTKLRERFNSFIVKLQSEVCWCSRVYFLAACPWTVSCAFVSSFLKQTAWWVD